MQLPGNPAWQAKRSDFATQRRGRKEGDTMPIDRNSVITAAQNIERSDEDRATKRVARQVNALIARANSDTNHRDLEIVDFVLNLRPDLGDEARSALLQKLGVNKPSEEGEGGTVAGLDKYIYVYDEHGEKVNAVRRDDQARINQFINDGFLPDEDGGGNVTKLQKPRHITAPAPQPAATAHKVKVLDKRGSVKATIDLEDYQEDPSKYQVVETDDDGRPISIREVRFIGR